MQTNTDLLRLAQTLGVPPVCCVYEANEPGVAPSGTVVYALHGNVVPAIPAPPYVWKRPDHWRFLGKEAASFTRAVAWATQAFGVDLWSPSPFGGVVPKVVIDVAYARRELRRRRAKARREGT